MSAVSWVGISPAPGNNNKGRRPGAGGGPQPNEPESRRAVREVRESIVPFFEANPKGRKAKLLYAPGRSDNAGGFVKVADVA